MSFKLVFIGKIVSMESVFIVEWDRLDECSELVGLGTGSLSFILRFLF